MKKRINILEIQNSEDESARISWTVADYVLEEILNYLQDNQKNLLAKETSIIEVKDESLEINKIIIYLPAQEFYETILEIDKEFKRFIVEVVEY